MQEIEIVYRKHYNYFLSIVRHKGVSHHHAEEIVQDAFLRVIEADSNADVFTQIKLSLDDVISKHQIQEKNKGMTGTKDTVDEDEMKLFHRHNSPNPEKTFGDKEILEDVRRRIQMKPRHIEDVLIKHLVHGMDYDRISKETGKAYKTICNIVLRFRKELDSNNVDDILHRRSGPEPNNFGQSISFKYNPNDWPVIKKA